jgi:hypothetical protein
MIIIEVLSFSRKFGMSHTDGPKKVRRSEGSRDAERLGSVVHFEEVANLTIAELMKIRFPRFENFAGLFVLEGATAKGDDAVALGDIVVHTIVDHLPVVVQSCKIAFDVVFAVRRTGKFHRLCPFSKRAEAHVVGHRDNQ